MMNAQTWLAIGSLLLMGGVAQAAPSTYQDPAGDDFGPGSYEYPTASEYTKGSFDLREVTIKNKGAKVEFKVTLGARIDDPWDSKSWPGGGQGFSLQMVQIYLDTDGKAGSGFTNALPGINAEFASETAWDKVVLLSPQPTSRIKTEISAKAKAMAKSIIVPQKVIVRGKSLIVTVKASQLGGKFNPSWGLQALVQSNEGFPDKGDLLSRKVNEYPGKHRFGGGNDYDCDPHVLDILAGAAKGAGDEKDAQRAALAYECGDEGASKRRAVIPMIFR